MLRLLAVTLLAAPCAALAVVCPGGMGAVRTRPSLRIRCAADDGSSSAGKGFGTPKRAAPPAAAPPREPVSRSGATADAAGADDGAAMEARGRLALEAMRREARRTAQSRSYVTTYTYVRDQSNEEQHRRNRRWEPPTQLRAISHGGPQNEVCGI